MLKFRDSILLNMDTLVHYESENPEFKNEAKNLLTNFLGFKPDLHASWKQELNIRIALERVREGTLTSEQLKKQGFNARKIGANKYGLHQVVYSSYTDRLEALQALRDVKKTHNKEAWLLVKDLN